MPMQLSQQFSVLRNFNYVNVKDYGATGDGTTDDTTAIGNAITAAGTVGGIFIPEGTYLISADLTIPSNFNVQGGGRNCILKARTGNQPNIFNLSSVSHVTIENLTIDGNKAGVTALGIQYVAENGIFMFAVDDVTIKNCYIHDCAVSGIMANGSCTNLMIANNRLTGCYDNQIYVRAKSVSPYNTCSYGTITGNVCSGGSFSGIQLLGSNYFTVSDNTCYANGPTSGQGDGVGCEGGSYNVFANNVCYNNGVQGVNIRGTTEVGATQISSHIVVSGNLCYNNTSTGGDAGGISITDTDDIVVSGNMCYGNGFNINVTDVMSQGATHVHLIGNTCRGSSDSGIRITPSSGVDYVVENCYVTDSGGDNLYTIKQTFIQGGVFARAATSKEGIHLASGSDKSRILGAYIYDNRDNGILMDSPVTGVEIRNCTFENVVGTNQARALQEQSGAGPTRMVNCRIINQATNPYVFNHADSRYYDEQTFGTVTKTGAYTVLAQDDIILCNFSAGATITIPNPSNMNGRVLTIKDIAGNANTFNITVSAASGNIDGSASKVINTAYGVVRLVTNGSNWFTT